MNMDKENIAAFKEMISRCSPEEQKAIALAREEYNGDNIETPIDSDAEYWCMVFARANQSYAKQYGMVKA